MFASDPIEGRKLNIAGEIKSIESAINDSPCRESLQLKVVWNTAPEDILYEICKYHPRIVHYSGRGTSRGLILHSSMVKNEVEMLFMNSCFSSVRSKTIVNEIEQLICLKGYADDKAAVLFPGLFYRYLFCGYSAGKSLELAKTELLLRKIRKGYEPVYVSKFRDKDWFVNNNNIII